MSTFQPITPNWLTAAFDQFVADDPELPMAYDYTDYPSEMSGEGNWLDLFLDETERFPVGRLWINPETGNIGLEELKYGNISHLTKIALELREYHYHDVDPLQAYSNIRSNYYADEEQTGELADAKIQTMTDTAS